MTRIFRLLIPVIFIILALSSCQDVGVMPDTGTPQRALIDQGLQDLVDQGLIDQRLVGIVDQFLQNLIDRGLIDQDFIDRLDQILINILIDMGLIDPVDQNLVGSWEQYQPPGQPASRVKSLYHFYNDRTGYFVRSDGSPISVDERIDNEFTWIAVGGTVYLEFNNGDSINRSYEISDGVLSVDMGTSEEKVFKVQIPSTGPGPGIHDQNLVGSWEEQLPNPNLASKIYLYYRFERYGSGFLEEKDGGPIDAGDPSYAKFSWICSNGVVFLEFSDGGSESHTYEVTDTTLTLDSGTSEEKDFVRY